MLGVRQETDRESVEESDCSRIVEGVGEWLLGSLRGDFVIY